MAVGCESATLGRSMHPQSVKRRCRRASGLHFQNGPLAWPCHKRRPSQLERGESRLQAGSSLASVPSQPRFTCVTCCGKRVHLLYNNYFSKCNVQISTAPARQVRHLLEAGEFGGSMKLHGALQLAFTV